MAKVTHPSPHHNVRNGRIRLIVLHADAGQSDAGTLSWCAAPESKVSYHVLVGRKGDIYTMVPEDRHAWHAGKSEWSGVTDVNSISIGLAFANRHDGVEPLTPAQVGAMRSLVANLRLAYPSIEAVVTHADVSPGRKTDPTKAPGFVLSDYTLDPRPCVETPAA